MSAHDDTINPWRLWHGAFVPEWLCRRPEPSAGAKLAYARLCRFAGNKGVARTTLEELGEELGVGERQAARYTRELSKLKLLRIQRQGLGDANLYRFPRHPWMGLDGEDTYDVSRPDTYDGSGPDTSDRSEDDARVGAERTHRTAPKTTRASGPSSDLESQEKSPLARGTAAGGASAEAEQLRDTLAGELGHGPMTDHERSAWGFAIAQLVAANATAEQIRQRVAQYRRQWPSVAVTPMALVKHWGALAARPTAPTTGIGQLVIDCAECGGGGWLIALTPGESSTPCSACNPPYPALEAVR